MLDKEEEERRERLRQLVGNDAANFVHAARRAPIPTPTAALRLVKESPPLRPGRASTALSRTQAEADDRQRALVDEVNSSC